MRRWPTGWRMWAAAAGRRRSGWGPLSREEVAEETTGLVGGPPPERLVDDLYARGEGNPFFTEQLVAAAEAEAADGVLRLRASMSGGRNGDLWPCIRGGGQAYGRSIRG